MTDDPAPVAFPGPPRRLPALIETERLRLRGWREADAAPLRRLWAERDPRARRRIDAEGRPSVEDLRLDIAERMRASAQGGPALLVLEPRAEPVFAGYCGLIVGQATDAEPEIAFELPRAFHGRGWATEAALAVLEAADAAGWTRLWSTVRAWNTPSRRVMARTGFVESGRIDPDPVRGDSIWYVREAAAR